MKQMKINKKTLAFLMAALMCVNMTACSAKADDEIAPDVSVSVEQEESLLDSSAQALKQLVSEPKCGSVGGDWTAFGLVRWDKEVSENWLQQYYEKAEAFVAERAGILDERKYTEYSRMILALTAIGKDPADIQGYNLLTPLADFDQTIFQGLNGPIYALLALDSGNYDIPENTAGSTQATRELYVDYILSMEAPDGGWSLSGGGAEVDITAMALQALAKYQEQPAVSDAIERALTFLSDQQNDLAGYTSYGADGSESVAQVIVALTELGLSIDDPRFVKNGRTLEDRLMDFRTQDGAFCHTMSEEPNVIATEQAFYALVALDRAEKGEASLYRMAEDNE